MERKIIQINEDKCNGCGLCADACHEGAIGMVDGKAKLLRDDYCDGLGDCLPACPTGAITFVTREAMPYDEAAVFAAKKPADKPLPCGCPGSNAKVLTRPSTVQPAVGKDNAPLPCGCPGSNAKSLNRSAQPHIVVENDEFDPSRTNVLVESELMQWPVQIKLVPVSAPYFRGAKLLIAADCAAYAYASFHKDFIKGKITLIGCPKLDNVDYTEKLAEIIRHNDIKSVTAVRMEVPCCGGIESAVKNALMASGKFLPWNVVTLSTDGKILD